MEEAGAVSGVLAALTFTGVNQERLNRLLQWPGHQFPAELFSVWLKAPVKRPSRRGGGGIAGRSGTSVSLDISGLLLLFPSTPSLFSSEMKITGAR